MSQTSFSPSEVKNIWQQMCASLQPQITAGVYNAFILACPITSIDTVDDSHIVITITGPSAFHATTVKKNLDGQLKQTLEGITGKAVTLEYKIGSIASAGKDRVGSATTIKDMSSVAPAQPSSSDLSPRSPHSSSPSVEELFSESTLSATSVDRETTLLQQIGLRRDYTFSTFAVSGTNEMAHAAATAVSNKPGISYNPLFLYGGVGVGKTHLMHAIGGNILHNDLNKKIIYCSGEEFTNEIVQAIQNKKATTFKYKYRNCDVLLIDDIQFIAGKNAVQEEFFHTFNALTQQLKQVVMTSDRPPHEITLLEDRLRSRFEAGLMIDIGQPTFELRTAILLIKAKAAQLMIPMELAKIIAAKVDSARRLEGIIKKIRSEVELKKRTIDEELINDILRLDEPVTQKQLKVSPLDVIKTVANHFRLKQVEIKGRKRQRRVVTARHISMYVLKNELEMPLAEIGKWFENRDHTSVLHAVRKIEVDLLKDPDIQQELNAVVTSLRVISR